MHYSLQSFNSDSYDWSTAIVKGPALFDRLNGKCSDANTKPAIISNRIQFEKFIPKLNRNYNDGHPFWLGLRLTSQGIIQK